MSANTIAAVRQSARPIKGKSFNASEIKMHQTETTAKTNMVEHWIWFKERLGHLTDMSQQEEVFLTLSGLYKMIIVEAKGQKDFAQFNEGGADEEEQGGIRLKDDRGALVILIVAGPGVRSDITKHQITFSMAQALISIALTMMERGPDVQIAPLGATLNNNRVDAQKYGWACNIHGGLHFVAGFALIVKQLSDDELVTKELSKKGRNALPDLDYCVGAAMGLDVTRLGKTQEYDTTRALMMTTGLEWNKYPKLKASDWGVRVTGGQAKVRAMMYAKQNQGIFQAVATTTESGLF